MTLKQDPSGAANTKTPLLMVCNCQNGGTCLELSAEELEFASSLWV